MLREKTSGKEKKGLAAIVAVAVLALLALAANAWFRRAAYPRAVISCDGREVAVLALADYGGEAYLSMSDFGVDVPVHFELRDHRIRFADVECPDKLCEGFGFIGSPLQTAVCMPNRVSVSITDP